MSVTVHFSCGGCDATAEGTGPIRMEFRSFSGRSWGFGASSFVNTPLDVKPDGWVPFDPYTYACYCPACWAEIESHKPADPEE